MRKLWNNMWDFLDPSRQGPFFWKYGWKGIVFIVLVTWGMHHLIVSPVNHGIAGLLQFFTIGVHEAGHPLFRYLFLGNFKMTIWGGTLMEIGVPVLAYLWCLHRRWMVQSDICLLWIAIACHSIGHYAGCSLDPTITLLNAGPESVPDWDYMHQWLGTEGYEWHIRHTFYWFSALFTGLGIYLAAVHFWKWNDPDNRNYNEDDGYDFFNGIH